MTTENRKEQFSEKACDLLMIEGNEKKNYIDMLVKAVGALKAKCIELGYTDIADYCSTISKTLGFFRYERSAEEKFGVPEFASIGIDPTNSGFPNSEWLRKLFVQQQLSSEYIARLPKLEQILDSARAELLAGNMPVEEQEELCKLFYYENLSKTQLAERRKWYLKTGEEAKAEFYKKEENMDLQRYKNDFETGSAYALIATGFDITKNLYSYFNITFFHESKKQMDKETAEQLANYFFEQCFPWNARMAFLSFGALSGIRPKHLDKFVIGPFYYNGTRNTSHLEAVFERFEQPWLLRFRKESCRSKKSVQLTKQESKELCSDETREEYVLCPHALKRALDELFANESNEFKVMGV